MLVARMPSERRRHTVAQQLRNSRQGCLTDVVDIRFRHLELLSDVPLPTERAISNGPMIERVRTRCRLQSIQLHQQAGTAEDPYQAIKGGLFTQLWLRAYLVGTSTR